MKFLYILFLEENNHLSFIKPANYEISKTRKYRNDISRVENMEYIEDSDCYICKNQRILSKQYVRNSKTKTGYKREFTVYKCDDCSDCPFKRDCIKGNNCKIPFEERNKVLQVSKKFMKFREEDLERIISEEGCQLRMNRSIQVEGFFGNIKQDVGFRRYLSIGKQNVTAESILLAMAHNINKLHRKIQFDRIGNHLFDLKTIVQLNQELTKMHEEVLNNLESIHGALLRMNRSIQAEGTFGIIKYDRWYKRIVRRGLDSIQLELFLVSIGHNLYKFYNKHYRVKEAA